VPSQGYVVEDGNFLHGFVRDAGGTITVFDAPAASPLPFYGTVAFSINTAGMITGLYEDANAIYHGYVRFPDGTFTTFDAPGAGTGANQGTFAESINDLIPARYHRRFIVPWRAHS
jgi:hypothetical protein